MKRKTESPESLARTLARQGIESATLSVPKPGATADKTRVRRVALKGDKEYQCEELRGAQAFHKNLSASELEAYLARWLAEYGRADILTAQGSADVIATKTGELSVLFKEASRKNLDTAIVPEGPCAIDSHDRAKNYILKEGIPVPFLVDLGVMTQAGEVVKSRYDKFRQINRFLEFIADVVPELEKAAAERESGEITVVDFGCGKSYLTFAVYYYLTAIRGIRARIVGLDLKEDVIANCESLAREYGYDGLKFSVGDIADYAGAETADMVITLHACDTATDLALAQAVRWGARVILSVPCCQHELNAQLAEPAPNEAAANGRATLAPAFKHGIIRERMAALLTDAMRAELLDIAGYRVQVLEFIDMSHTPKNLLIRAVKERGNGSGASGNDSEYRALRDFLGAAPTLERELGKE